jgi:hypothetical protein
MVGATVKIERNPARERTVLNALRESFSREERTGIHMSDVIKPRQAYFKRILPQPLTESSILYFLAGRGHEEVFARLAGVQLHASDVVTVKIPGLVGGEQRFWTVPGLSVPVSYRPDFRWDEEPFEFKTRRSNLAQPGQEADTYDSYLEQHLAYCMADEKDHGILGCFSLLEGNRSDPLNPTHPELAIYDVWYSPGDLSFAKERLEKNALAFEAALKDGTVKGGANLPLCAPWMCGKNRKTVVLAAWCQECKKELAEPWASKHTDTKTGAGHHVSPEAVRWDYVPRCEWYEFSRPQLVDPTRGSR